MLFKPIFLIKCQSIYMGLNNLVVIKQKTKIGLDPRINANGMRVIKTYQICHKFSQKITVLDM